jgi:hypothetical protein
MDTKSIETIMANTYSIDDLIKQYTNGLRVITEEMNEVPQVIKWGIDPDGEYHSLKIFYSHNQATKVYSIVL